MKINHISSLDKFFDAVASCGGKVYVEDMNGNRFQADKKAGRFIAALNGGDKPYHGDLRILAEHDADLGHIMRRLAN